MGQVLHGSATTTEAVRRAIQNSQESLRVLAIDRTSKFAYVELHEKAGKMAAAQFLRNLIALLPYSIHTVLTDNGIQLTNHERHLYAGFHIFDRVCSEHDIEHRLLPCSNAYGFRIMVMKAVAIALIGTLTITSSVACAENLPADTVPVLSGATVRSIGQKPCNVSLREWTHDSEKDAVAFYANWAASKGLKPSGNPPPSAADPRLWFFENTETHASVTVMFGTEADHNFVGVNYEVGSSKQGCPDSPMIL